MRHLSLALLAIAFAAVPGARALAVPAGYALTLDDEFDRSALDPTIWDYRLSGPRRDAVNTPDAVALDGEGHLVIDTWTEEGVHYTGMIGTQGRFEQAYGWFEARIRFEDAPGMWSAFWLQSSDMGSFLGDPERAGVEMDIVEHDLFTSVTTIPTWHAALHWDGYGSEHKFRDLLVPTADIGDGFHTFALEWTPTVLRFYYDGMLLWDASAGPISQRAEYLILSSEVEGSILNEIPADGYGPLGGAHPRMLVDWVRVYALPAPGGATLVASAVLGLAALRRIRRSASPGGS